MKTLKWFIIVAIFTLLIWIQSFLNGSISSSESSFITEIASHILNFVGIYPSIENLHHIIRKIAHFTEYFILGILWLKALISINKINYKNIVYILCVILMVAAIDEAIQFLHIDRTSSWTDFMIDGLGGLSGILVFMFIKMLYNRHVKKIKETEGLASAYRR